MNELKPCNQKTPDDSVFGERLGGGEAEDTAPERQCCSLPWAEQRSAGPSAAARTSWLRLGWKVTDLTLATKYKFKNRLNIF